MYAYLMSRGHKSIDLNLDVSENKLTCIVCVSTFQGQCWVYTNPYVRI